MLLLCSGCCRFKLLDLRANLKHYPPSGIFPSTTNPLTWPSVCRALRELQEHESSELEREVDCRLSSCVVVIVSSSNEKNNWEEQGCHIVRVQARTWNKNKNINFWLNGR